MVELRNELTNCKNLAEAKNLLGGASVVAVRDYKESKRYIFTDSGVEVEEITLPKSNVLLYELGGNKGIDWACARPSGTEPKLKIYFGVYGDTEDGAKTTLEKVKEEMSSFVKGRL